MQRSFITILYIYIDQIAHNTNKIIAFKSLGIKSITFWFREKNRRFEKMSD